MSSRHGQSRPSKPIHCSDGFVGVYIKRRHSSSEFSSAAANSERPGREGNGTGRMLSQAAKAQRDAWLRWCNTLVETWSSPDPS